MTEPTSLEVNQMKNESQGFSTTDDLVVLLVVSLYVRLVELMNMYSIQ